uniref:ALMS motif domain-containing protein n=1 Tax=Leptobrachium leishanense TaxID=445787 RepID=A0A8C5WBG1_9ANUR
MEGSERERGDPVTPIATTPPASRLGVLEDLQSQSSSPGTHISSTSGVSLGEAIRHSASQGMESWYRLPAEEDVSGFSPQSCDAFLAAAEDTELPTMEEGALPAGKGAARSVLLEMQDSVLSPCLPLLTSASAQVTKYFDETLYQQTDMEFAPLRGSLDMSGFPGQPPLQMSDAVALASKEASEISVGESISLSEPVAAHGDGGGASLCTPSESPRTDFAELSSHPIREAVIPKFGNLNADSLDELDRMSNSGDGSFLDSSVPAPVLIELLEKEVRLSGSSESSSRCSSLQAIPSKEGENIGDPLDDVPRVQTHNLSSPPTISDPSVKEDYPGQPDGEIFKDSSEIDFFSADAMEDFERRSSEFSVSDRLRHSGITVRTSLRQSSEPGNADLQKQLCTEIQQRYEDKELVKASERLKEEDLARQTRSETPPEPHRDETTVIGQSREELMISSNGSIERGHKDTGISPSDSFPAGEASFTGRLVKPISQSTPGASAADNVKRKLTDRLMEIKAKLTGSQMSLNEEPSISPSRGVTEVASTDQGCFASSDSQRSPSPQRRRIQSLPSLNYIEKVGSWNTNQSFDALVLRGAKGMSPKKKAFNAVADSLNRMLSKQVSTASPRRGPSASFTGASSMTNLNVNVKESSVDSPLSRSQSYNSVIAVNTENARQGPEGVKEPLLSDERDRSVSVQNCETVEDGNTRSLDPLVADAEGKTKDLEDDQLSGGDVETRPAVSAAPPTSTVTTESLARHDVGGLGHFSDVSLDNDLSSSSHSSEPVHQLSMDSAAAASLHSLTSLEVDNFVPYWSPAHASLQKEIDIEERIPTYLRNLGIAQSPTTILTPFTPKGPIREPEFSPSELRTIKGSTATPTKSTRLSEGGSQSAVNISQSSIYSTASTVSVSIPMGSEVGQVSPSPTEISPSFKTRSAADPPVTQPDTNSDQATNVLPHPPIENCKRTTEFVSAELELHDVHETHHVSPGLQPEAEDHADLTLKHVKKLIGQFDSRDVLPDRSLLHSVEESPFHFRSKVSEIEQTTVSTNDSFVGSKTLKEIRQLLAEADTVGLDGSGAMFPQLKDVYDQPLVLKLGFDDSLKSNGLLDRSTSSLDHLVQNMSWDDSLNTSDDSTVRGDPGHAGTTWDNSSIHKDPRIHSHHAQGHADNHMHLEDPHSFHKVLVRSEPEGFKKGVDSLTVYDEQTREETGSDKTSPQGSSGDGGYNKDLLGTMTGAARGLEQAMASAGYIPVREDVPESDDSSADSLAARVMSLLRSNPPLARTAPCPEEDEPRLRGSLKLKLAAQPSLPDTELNEDDRRRIEEIKRELLEGAKAIGSTKDPLVSAFEVDHLRPWARADQSRLQTVPPPVTVQSHGVLLGSTSQPTPTIDAGERTCHSAALTSRPVPAGQALRTPELPLSGYIAAINQASSRKATGLDNQSDAQLDDLLLKPSEETNKPISSITFSSRKRLSPLLSSIGSEKGDQELFVKAEGWRSPFASSTMDQREATKASDFNFRSNEVINVNFQQITPESRSPAHRDAEVSDPSATVYSEGHRKTPCDGDDHQPSLSFAVDKHDVQDDNLRGDSITGPSSRQTPIDRLMDTGLACHDLSMVGRYRAGGPSPGLKDIDGASPQSSLIFIGQSREGRPSQSSSDELNVASSPGMKALSGIHVKISPQQDGCKQAGVLDHSKAGREITSPAPQRSDATPSAEDEGRAPEHAAVAGRTRMALSDATTQITTESPEKTTFSAEIYIDSSKRHEEPERPSNLKARGTPEQQPAPHRPIPYLSRATDQPLLLPYRPPGSPELYYVPYFDGVSHVSTTSTVESSHPGSNDAVSPKFPSDVLGSAAFPRHAQGIYSKSRLPDTTGKETLSAGFSSDSVLPRKLQPPYAPDMTRSSPPAPEYQFGSFVELPSGSLHQKRSSSGQKPKDKADRFMEKRVASLRPEDEFLPLKPELDHYPERRPNAQRTPRHKAHHEEPAGTQTKRGAECTGINATCVTRRSPDIEKPLDFSDKSTKPQPSSQRGERNARGTLSSSALPAGHKISQHIGSTSNQSAVSNHSLDDLWARFTDRRRSPLSETSNKLEISLVERLDRLARLLQGSPSQSLVSEKDHLEEIREEPEREDHDRRWGSEKAGERVHHGKREEEPGYTGLDETEIPLQPRGRTRRQALYEESVSDGSVTSDVTPAVRNSGTETATQTCSEATVESATSSSVSTIDTVRLIRAFGPERVRPSSKLSKLYNAISLQKERTEGKPKKSGRQPAAIERALQERSEYPPGHTQVDLSSTSSSSWKPSPALRHKRSRKFLNKGIQAGDLEIVTSATRRNTRDVGTTFPSPRGEGQKVRSESTVGRNEGRSRNEDIVAQRGKNSKMHLPNGLSWFVPADILKSDSRKENVSGLKAGPALAWYEPVTSTKPWREPLREKHLQEQLPWNLLSRSHLPTEASTKPLAPFIKVTLQEFLETRRPDFIFRSGERVKRLQLLAKERKLQSEFQGERDKLFNQPERRRGGSDERMKPHKASRAAPSERAIPRKEMVQRSKRMYEQLPEVRKKKEDDKRRSEYESHRLKAHLFRKKVTNQVLGRKTPWN